MSDTDKALLEEMSKEQLAAAREGMIPINRFNDETTKLKGSNQKLSEELANLQGQVSTLQTSHQSAPAQEPKEYTRTQLRSFVESGDVTQEQADDYWDAQVERKSDAKFAELKKEMSHQVVEGNTAQSLSSEVDKYMEHIPGVSEAGHEDREKLQIAYNRLAARLGMPEKGSKRDLELQVLALEDAFGPVSKLGKRTRQNNERETMQETGGDSSKSSTPEKGILKDLSPEKKAYYESRVGPNKLYANWDAVKEELEYDPSK